MTILQNSQDSAESQIILENWNLEFKVMKVTLKSLGYRMRPRTFCSGLNPQIYKLCPSLLLDLRQTKNFWLKCSSRELWFCKCHMSKVTVINIFFLSLSMISNRQSNRKRREWYISQHSFLNIEMHLTHKKNLSIEYLSRNPLSNCAKGCYKWMPSPASLRPVQGFLLPWWCSPAQCAQRPGGVSPRSTDVAVAFQLTGSTSSEAQLCTLTPFACPIPPVAGT